MKALARTRLTMLALILCISLSLIASFGINPNQGAAAEPSVSQSLVLTGKELIGQIATFDWTNLGSNFKYEIYYLESGYWTLLQAGMTTPGYATGDFYEDFYGVTQIRDAQFKVVARNTSDVNDVRTSNIVTPTPLPFTGSGTLQADGSIKLTWAPISGFTTYQIYRRTTTTTLQGPLATIQNTTYTDTSRKLYNVTYSYDVCVTPSAPFEYPTCFGPISVQYLTRQIDVIYRFNLNGLGDINWGYNANPNYTGSLTNYLQGISIYLSTTYPCPTCYNAHISYLAHFQDYGWSPNWVKDGQPVGTGADGISYGNGFIVQDRRMEAIRIILQNMEGVHVEYRANVEGIGWQNWVRDGAVAGTTGQSRKLISLQIRLVYD